MEASETTPVDGGESQSSVFDGEPVEHQPISESDAHGTVTPSSAPPASAQSGDPLDPATKAGLGLGGAVPRQGESTP